MQPKNKSERTKAFLNFVLLFVISITIILTTIFFSIQVPVKEANALSKKMYQVDKEKAFTDNFFLKMSEIVVMLDSIDHISGNTQFYDNQIAIKLSNLQAKVNADTTVYNKNFYFMIVENISNLQQAKENVRKATKTDNDVKEQQDKIEKLQDVIRQYNQQSNKQ